jgi:choline-sulfatase
MFENAFSQAPLTLPSHCSILTGTTIPYHKVRTNGSYALPGELDTLAEILKRENYTTSAFIASFTLDSRFGLDQGFDVYNDKVTTFGNPIKSYNSERSAELVFNDFSRWFETNFDQPFFSWVHFYDPHIVYAPPEPYLLRFKDNPYDGEIAYMDEYVGKIFALLKSKNILKNTLVVIVGDHGEAFGEHGEYGHQIFCYKENLKGPFIINGPRLPRQKRVSPCVSVMDVMPTILDYLDISHM